MGTALAWLVTGFLAGVVCTVLWQKGRSQLKWYHVVLSLFGFLVGCLAVGYLVTSLIEDEPRAALIGTLILGLLSLIALGAVYRLWPKSEKPSAGKVAAKA